MSLINEKPSRYLARYTLGGFALGLVFLLAYVGLMSISLQEQEHSFLDGFTNQTQNYLILLLPFTGLLVGYLVGKRLQLLAQQSQSINSEFKRLQEDQQEIVGDLEEAKAQENVLKRDLEKSNRVYQERTRQMETLNSELNNEIRKSQTMRSQITKMEERIREFDRELIGRTSQFDRIKKEMESQITALAEMEERLLESQTRLQLLNSLSTGMTSGTHVDQIIERTVKEIKKSFRDLRVYYAEISTKGFLKVSHTTRVQGLGQFLGISTDLNMAPNYLTNLRDNKPVIVEDITMEKDLRPLLYHFSSRGTSAMLEVPVHFSGELVGLLGFASFEPRRWDEHEIATLSEIANFLGLAFKEAEVEKQREHAAKVLLEAKEAAETATRAKSDFLATMSHEIRTPLNGIIGMTRMMLTTELSKEQEEYAKIVHSSGELLLTIINDVLDYSKIEAGKLELEHIDFSVREVMESVGEILAVKAQEKGLELLTYVDPKCPEFVVGDPGRLSQIFMNLMNNAIKFTETGDIRAEARLVSHGTNTMRLECRVIDTGIGIPKNRVNRLFKSFSQVDASTTRKYGGTGLGLTISKRLAEAMNGNIRVESVEGEGSTFIFEIVLGLSTREAKSVVDPDLKGLRVLFCEPNPHARQIVFEQLQALGCQGLGTSSAEDALGLVRTTAKRGESFTACFVEEKQYVAFKAGLKEIKFLNGAPPVVCMTPITKKVVLDIPPEEYTISKPLKREVLRQTIRVATGIDTNAKRRPSGTFEVIRDRQGYILVVDDQMVNRKLCSLLLKKAGYQFKLAENGEEALEMLEKEHFDVVLMDCRMPKMDGYEATRALRSREQDMGGHTPVIALTASAMQEDKQACIDAGMDDFLAKPLDEQNLFDKLDFFLNSEELDERAPSNEDTLPPGLQPPIAVSEEKETEQVKTAEAPELTPTEPDSGQEQDAPESESSQPETPAAQQEDWLEDHLDYVMTSDGNEIDEDSNPKDFSLDAINDDTHHAGMDLPDDFVIVDQPIDHERTRAISRDQLPQPPSPDHDFERTRAVNRASLQEQARPKPEHGAITKPEAPTDEDTRTRAIPINTAAKRTEPQDDHERTRAINLAKPDAQPTAKHDPQEAAGTQPQDDQEKTRAISRAVLEDQEKTRAMPRKQADDDERTRAIPRSETGPGHPQRTQPIPKAVDGDDPNRTQVVSKDQLLSESSESNEIPEDDYILPEDKPNSAAPPADVDRIRSAIGDDAELLAELLNLFLSESERNLENLGEVIEIGDATRIRELAHGLKGAAANIGAHQLRECADVMENTTAKGSTENAAELLAKMKTHFEEIKVYLKQFMP